MKGLWAKVWEEGGEGGGGRERKETGWDVGRTLVEGNKLWS